MEKQKVTKGNLIVCWICEGVWLFTLLFALVSGKFSEPGQVILVIGAVTNAITTGVFTKRYIKGKEERVKREYEQNKTE